MLDKQRFENPFVDALAAVPGAGLKFMRQMVGGLDDGEVDRDAMELAAKVPEWIAKIVAGMPVEMVKGIVPGAGEVTNLAGNVPGAGHVPGLG